MVNLIAPLNTHTVYCITSPSTSTVYYGCSASSAEDRFDHHLRALANGYHGNHELQLAYDVEPLGWTVHQVARLPEQEANDMETALIEGDANCFNIQKNPRKRRQQGNRTKELVAAIQALLHTQPQYAIARRLGVSLTYVSRVSRGKHAEAA